MQNQWKELKKEWKGKLKLKRLKRFEKFKQGNELRKKITNSIVYERRNHEKQKTQKSIWKYEKYPDSV